ncbi:MAG: DNA translocase FtsK, partial [Planctomycetota bacterium]
ALGVGYGRGARLIDFMAEDGIVGQYAGSQAREVLLTLEQWAERNGTTPLPADPAPRKLKIQPHATVATAPADRDVAEDDEDDEEIDDELEGEDDVEEDWDDESDESSDLDAEDDADEDA